MIDFATRLYNHNFHIDPIVRSLLDDDIYKLLMNQLIWIKKRDVMVKFSIKNRTKSFRLADNIRIEELKAQLDYVKNLRFTPMELIWLQGQTFFGQKGIFKPDYIEYLRNFSLPDYNVSVEDGQYVITFEGKWPEVSLWEIHVLEILSTLKIRSQTADYSKLEFDILISNMKTKLWTKLKELKKAGATFVDFGTRRRFDFLWQEWAVCAAKDVMGDQFKGTSNMFLAMKHSLEAMGTNAHELPMVYAALAKDDEDLKWAQYQVLEDWMQVYNGNLLIALPDTFGSTQFFRNAPEIFFKHFKGVRWDSKDPRVAGENDIKMWEAHGKDPATKVGIASDGLDYQDIIELNNQYKGRLLFGAGWGTLFSNDTRGCSPRDEAITPLSIVCKATWAKDETMDDYRATVKLSDNPVKAMSEDPKELERYKKIFGLEGMKENEVIV